MSTPEENKRESTLSAFLVMICTFLSRIMGFLRSALIAALFGASGTADVLNAVFSIPNNLRKLFAEGALSSAFIPALSRQIVEDPTGKKAVQLSRNLIGLQFVILIPFLVLCLFFPQYIIKVFVQFKEPEKMELAIRLFRWIISYILLISVSSVLMAVLNTHKKFLIPALTPIMFSLTTILSIAFWHKQLGIFSMAIGVLTGGLAQILFQWPLYHKLGYRMIPRFDLRSPEFRQVIKQWGPVLLTSSVYSIMQQISMLLATQMPDGSSSALANAIVFWQLPFGLFSTPVTTVLFPQMSRLHAENNIEGMKSVISYGMRSMIVFLLPSTLVMIGMGREIIAVVLQRGAFTLTQTLMTARVLTAFTVGMLIVAEYNYLQRVFYSRGDFKRPIISAAVCAVTDIILSLVVLLNGISVEGLAYANSIAFLAGYLTLHIYLKKTYPYPYENRSLETLGKVLLSLVPAVGFLLLFRHLFGDQWWRGGSSLKGFLLLMIQAAGTGILVLIMYILLKVEFVSMLKRRKPSVI
jgi:putative peptidoglycan lipid II flippase